MTVSLYACAWCEEELKDGDRVAAIQPSMIETSDGGDTVAVNPDDVEFRLHVTCVPEWAAEHPGFSADNT